MIYLLVTKTISLPICDIVVACVAVFVEAEQPDGYIMIQPSDGVHVKALGKNFGLTCTAMNTGDQEDPNLRWFGPDDRLIRETSGRYVSVSPDS